MLTKTWFHTGVYLHGGRISRHLDARILSGRERDGAERPSSHYEQIQAMLLDDTILPAQLTPYEAREACRALKGSTLRQEVYALDGQEKSTRPYISRGKQFHDPAAAAAADQPLCGLLHPSARGDHASTTSGELYDDRRTPARRSARLPCRDARGR